MLLEVVATVALTDLGYYATHPFLSHGSGANPLVRSYRSHHARHHAVETLDFLRGNVSTVADTAVLGFQLPLGLISAAIGLFGTLRQAT